MIFATIFSIWLILIIFLSLFKLKWGVALFLAYMILVPVVQFRLGGLRLGANYFNLLFFICFCFYARLKNIKLHWQPLVPFFIFFLVWLIIMPLHSIPTDWMLNRWVRNAMNMLILPFVMYNVMANDPSSIRLFRNTMLVCIVIAIGYGLAQTQTPGENPYQMLCFSIFDMGDERFDMEYFEHYYSVEGNTGRLFGRLTSVYTHPMGFALFIGLSLVYVYYLRAKLKKIPVFILLLAIAVMAVICGVRSVIGGLVVAVAFYLFVKRNYKMFIAIMVVGAVVYVLMEQIPELNTYLSSISDVTSGKRHDVGGSSIEMRLDQLRGALNEASKSPVIGLGYEWTSYYQSIHGPHPVCLAFESLIYVAVCNGAMVGCLLWIYLIIAVMVNNKRLSSDSALLNTALVFWIAYACITGEYGYMKTFLIFYILMLGEQLLQSRDEQENNTIAEASALPSQLIDKPETTSIR